jgi:hypothetical protein
VPTDGHEPTTAVWREQAIAEITAQRFLIDRVISNGNASAEAHQAVGALREHLETARAAATDQNLGRVRRISSAVRGAGIERAWSHIDAAEEALLQIAPDSFVRGQMPRVLRRVQEALEPGDKRRCRLEEIVRRQAQGTLTATDRQAVLTLLRDRLSGDQLSATETESFREVIDHCTPTETLSGADREALFAAFHAANCESRRKQTRVRSFRNMLYLCALVLIVAAVGLAVLGFARPDLATLCFEPSDQVVCPTQLVAVPPAVTGGGGLPGQPAVNQSPEQEARQDAIARATADPFDVLLIELIGLIAAAVAAAIALRDMRGTSAPYGVPLALAVLKLPTGALTAALGLLLMRGQFVPGLSALDSPAQIIAWAIVFGYAQQLFTRFVDRQAMTVLENAGVHSTPEPDPQRARTPVAVPA